MSRFSRTATIIILWRDIPMTKKNRSFNRAGLIISTALLFFIIIFLRVLFSGETTAPGLIMINPGCQPETLFEANWPGIMDALEIYEWGRGRGLYLVDDRPPMIDKRAAVFDERGSSVTVKGLDPSKKYRLWMDFVSFVGNAGGEFFSPLTVTVKNLRTGKSYPKKIKVSDIDNFALFSMKLPFEITSGVDITIEFREDAPRYGGWGIWDMFIGEEGAELPQSIKCPPAQGKQMKVLEKPLE
jgi:hypothetical protein